MGMRMKRSIIFGKICEDPTKSAETLCHGHEFQSHLADMWVKEK